MKYLKTFEQFINESYDGFLCEKDITRDKIKDEAIKKRGNTFLKFLQKNNIDYTFTMDSITTPGLTEVILKDFDNMIISYDYKDNFIEIK